MSDDGFVDYDDYDDEDYVYWDDDGDIELADDLAEHTIPSPLWQDDPVFDTMDYYSDWDYYSDDYHEEIPQVAGKQDGQAQEKAKSLPIRVPRGTKRKHNEMLSDPNHPGHGRWIKGTVCKSSEEDTKEHPYEPGQQDRISFLKDWRDVFRDSQPKSDRRREELYKKRRNGDLPDRGVTEEDPNSDDMDSTSTERLTSKRQKKLPSKQQHSSKILQSVPISLHAGTSMEVEGFLDEFMEGSGDMPPPPNKKRKAVDDPADRSAAGKKVASGKAREEKPPIKRALRSRKT